MGGALVEALEDGARRSRYVAEAVILADEGLDRLQAVEPHQSLKLDLAFQVAFHQVDVSNAGDLPRLDPRDHLAANDSLISAGILRQRPSAPDPADHRLLPIWPSRRHATVDRIGRRIGAHGYPAIAEHGAIAEPRGDPLRLARAVEREDLLL